MGHSKLEGKPHMHIARVWHSKTGTWSWRAMERGTKRWPVATSVSHVERNAAYIFVAMLQHKELENGAN